jgi:phage-related protein (TIGR01555 family)
MAGILRNMADGLRNVLTGLGGAGERGGNRYVFCPISQDQIEAAYRGSGLLRKVIDIPAFDMTREWREWQGDGEQIEALEAEETRLGIAAKVKQCEILRGLGGGALILGAPGDLNMPVNSRGIGSQGLAFVHVVSRWQLTLGDMVEDLNDPLFGGPRYFEINTAQYGQQRLHPSRVVCFKGDPVPSISGTTWLDQFWGEGRIQRVLDAVTNSDQAQQAFASLIVKTKNTRIGISRLLDIASTTEGEARLMSRLRVLAQAESMYNWTLTDAGDGDGKGGETITDHQISWAGIPEIMYAFATFVAAVADIPVTRLLGRAAEGMNSSGQSQQTDWTKMVMARQKLELKPCLDQLDIALVPSALGGTPDGLWWKFAPLDNPTEAEEATRFKTIAEALDKIAGLNVIPDRAFNESAQNTLIENGFMVGLDAALAPLSDEERFGLSPDDDGTDPSALQAKGGDQSDLPEGGVPAQTPARRAANDAKPVPLYVQRKLLNSAELIAWAKDQGFTSTLPADDMHVTVLYSRTAVDPIKMGETWSGDDKGNLKIKPGGPRAVERLGENAVVLLFASSDLIWRHRGMVEAGASHDYDEYQPHVTLTYDAGDVDLGAIKPFAGELVFGPEIFEPLDLDWKAKVVEE